MHYAPQMFLLSDTTRATTDNTEKTISAVSSRTIIEVGSPSRKMPSSRPSAAHESTSKGCQQTRPVCACVCAVTQKQPDAQRQSAIGGTHVGQAGR